MPSQVALVVFGINGLLLVLLSVPLVCRRVHPNRLYGFRVPATLNDPRLWYEVNAKTGRDLMAVGLVQLALVGASALAWLSELALIAASLVCTAIGTLAAVAHGFAIIQQRRDAP